MLDKSPFKKPKNHENDCETVIFWCNLAPQISFAPSSSTPSSLNLRTNQKNLPDRYLSCSSSVFRRSSSSADFAILTGAHAPNVVGGIECIVSTNTLLLSLQASDLWLSSSQIAPTCAVKPPGFQPGCTHLSDVRVRESRSPTYPGRAQHGARRACSKRGGELTSLPDATACRRWIGLFAEAAQPIQCWRCQEFWQQQRLPPVPHRGQSGPSVFIPVFAAAIRQISTVP